MSWGVEQFATTFREVISQVRLVDLVRLLTWFFSTAYSPGAVPVHSVDDVLTAAMQLRMGVSADDTTSGFKSSHAPPVSSFTSINKQPSMSSSHSTSSGSPPV